MAIIHRASITPTKQEILDAELDGPVEVVGSYRLDDPEGEVGIEGFVVRRDGALQHVALTYRGSALDNVGARLVSTMQHSTLGPRWVYDAATDPVAVDCFRRAIRGEQEQAVLEVWADGERVETREPTIRLSARPGDAEGHDTVRLARELDESAPSATAPALVAAWDGGEAVVATLVAGDAQRA